MVAKKGLDNVIQCDSAGTAAYHIGLLPDKRMRQIASERGISLTHHARQLTHEDFGSFDYIMAMDESNFADIRNESYRANGQYISEQQLYLYRLFDPKRGESVIVPDPYFGEMSDFVDIYHMVERSGTQFLEYLIDTHNLSSQSKN